jgi:glycosyltransferase involved in cell wall biosynthesis
MTKSVSVILPCFNAENYLVQTLESIFSQDFKDYEIIAVNDGSTDRTAEILEDAAKIHKNMHVIHQDNMGESAAYMAGIDKSSAEYIVRHDADDLMTMDRISYQYAWMKSNLDIDFAGAWCSKFVSGGESGKLVLMPTNKRAFYFFYCFFGQIANPTSIIKRSVIGDVSLSRYKIGADLDLYLHLISKRCVGSNMPKMVVKYRVHSMQATASASEVAINNGASEIYDKYSGIIVDEFYEDDVFEAGRRWRRSIIGVEELAHLVIKYRDNIVGSNDVDNATTALVLARLFTKCFDFSYIKIPLILYSLRYVNILSGIFHLALLSAKRT